MATKKRINFTQREKETLLSVVAKYKHIVEDKSTKSFMIEKKNTVWSQIEKDYNCCAETGSRTSKQLKVLYENLKRETKKSVAEHHHDNYEAKLLEQEAKRAASNDKKEISKTGGGNADLALSSEQEILLATIREQVNPLENEFDNAAEYFNEVTVFECDPELEPEPNPAPEPEPGPSHQNAASPIPVQSQRSTVPKKRKRVVTCEDLRKQYYREKIKNEKIQRTILNLQAKKLRLEINKLKN